MRIAKQFALILLASSVAAHGQPFRQITISTGPSPRWIAVADVNHDRNPDIVVANAGLDSADSGSITVLIGDGRGGFHPASGSPFPAGHLPNDVAVGDMNNDGNLDPVVANHQSPYLRVFLAMFVEAFILRPGRPSTSTLTHIRMALSSLTLTPIANSTPLQTLGEQSG